MTKQISMRGTRYDDSEPLWLSTVEGKLLFNRVTERWVSWASLSARAAAEGWEWASREIGIPSLTWRLTHRTMDYQWGPGLDDTEGLASEIVSNGEVWTGAPVGGPAATPPDNWTISGTYTAQVFGGEILDIRSDPTLGSTMSQTVTGTPGEYYVVECIYTLDQSDGCGIGLDDVILPLPKVAAGRSSRMASFSFQMPASGTAKLSYTVAPGANSAIDRLRCFLESELTGVGVSTVDTIPQMPVDPVKGPYGIAGTTFWVNTENSFVGFNLDSDVEPDIWMTGQEVCDSDINDDGKIGINGVLTDNGCDMLPCITRAGKLKVAYSKPAEPAAKYDPLGE